MPGIAHVTQSTRNLLVDTVQLIPEVCAEKARSVHESRELLEKQFLKSEGELVKERVRKRLPPEKFLDEGSETILAGANKSLDRGSCKERTQITKH